MTAVMEMFITKIRVCVMVNHVLRTVVVRNICKWAPADNTSDYLDMIAISGMNID